MNTIPLSAVRTQYRKNSAQMRQMAADARRRSTNTINGYTVTELDRIAEHYQKMADGVIPCFTPHHVR
jgi:hypothetical protein